MKINKWCEGYEFGDKGHSCEAQDVPGYPWLLTLSLQLDNGEWININSGQPIVVANANQKINIVRTGPKTAKVVVE